MIDGNSNYKSECSLSAGIEMRPVKTLLFLPLDNSISDPNPIKQTRPSKVCPPLITCCLSDENLCSGKTLILHLYVVLPRIQNVTFQLNDVYSSCVHEKVISIILRFIFAYVLKRQSIIIGHFFIFEKKQFFRFKFSTFYRSLLFIFQHFFSDQNPNPPLLFDYFSPA